MLRDNLGPTTCVHPSHEIVQCLGPAPEAYEGDGIAATSPDSSETEQHRSPHRAMAENLIKIRSTTPLRLCCETATSNGSSFLDANGQFVRRTAARCPRYLHRGRA